MTFAADLKAALVSAGASTSGAGGTATDAIANGFATAILLWAGGGGGGGLTAPVHLTSQVDEILPAANGGTGSSSLPAGGLAGLTALAAGDAASVATAAADATTKANAAAAASQPLDSDLTAIAALTTTSYGRGLLALANQAALIAEVASAYQPLDSDLTAIAAVSTAAYGRSLLALANATALAAEVDSFFLTPAEGNAAYDATGAAAAAQAAAATDATTKANAAKAAAVYELQFTAGQQTVISTSLTRVGARKIDMSKYPTITGFTRHVRLLVDVDKTSGATSGTVQLYDETHSVIVTSTSMTTTSNANEEKDSGDLTVGSSSGNIRSDVVSIYTLQMQRTGGTDGLDAVFITNGRIQIYYT